MTTIIYAHPYDKSFNHAILETVKQRLTEIGKNFEVLDLYADGFNPAMEVASLALFKEGRTADSLAAKYSGALLNSDEVIFIFPIWWGRMPAIIEGFFDKVMLAGTAFKYTPEGRLVPDKFHINRTILFSTSEAPTKAFEHYFNDIFKPGVLDTVGMFGYEWHNCQGTTHGALENRLDFLELVKKTI